MAEETEENLEKEEPVKAVVPKKKGGWFQRVPREILLTPGGVILISLAALMEIIDFLVPWPIIEEVIMLPLNIFFCVGLIVIAKQSVKSLIIPFLIERIPLLSSIIPTFLIKMFI